jgi:hypothetical protein
MTYDPPYRRWGGVMARPRAMTEGAPAKPAATLPLHRVPPSPFPVCDGEDRNVATYFAPYMVITSLRICAWLSGRE